MICLCLLKVFILTLQWVSLITQVNGHRFNVSLKWSCFTIIRCEVLLFFLFFRLWKWIFRLYIQIGKVNKDDDFDKRKFCYIRYGENRLHTKMNHILQNILQKCRIYTRWFLHRKNHLIKMNQIIRKWCEEMWLQPLCYSRVNNNLHHQLHVTVQMNLIHLVVFQVLWTVHY